MPYDLSACGRVTVSELLVQESNATDGKGVILRNGDMPMITRGWDCFTSGPKAGIGRWGLFMEAGETYLAAPGTDYGGGKIGLGGFLADGTKQNILTVATCTKKVGIGTTCPAFSLHINSTTALDGLVVENTLRNITCIKSTGEHAFMYIDSAHQCIYQPSIFFMRAGTLFSELRLQRASSSDSLGNYAESEGVIGSTGNTPFSIQSCGTRRIHLASNGNIGVNTISPGTNLEVNGTDAEMMVHNPSNTRGGFRAFCNQRLGILTTDCSDSLVFGFENGHKGAFTERMRICNVTGRVGIGTSTASYLLHVNGTFYAAGSSVDYKQGICQYDTDSCMFMKLKPVTYQYKEEYKHLGKELKSETQIGLIAEEVAETYPELAILVKENDNDVVRNVDYEKLSIVLLAEVQKLRKEVDDLKTK
jgi:hypothetical protein